MSGAQVLARDLARTGHVVIDSRIHMRDPQGRLVEREQIRTDLLLQDEMVRDIVFTAEALSHEMAARKKAWFDQIDGFLDLLAQNYKARRAAKGNTTFTTFDGLMKVEVAMGDFLDFGPELQVGKDLLDELFEEWGADAHPSLRAVFNEAFSVGKEGKISVDRVLMLRRMRIDEPRWSQAMAAINDSIKVTLSRRYVRIHRRTDANSKWEQVKLDLASV